MSCRDGVLCLMQLLNGQLSQQDGAQLIAGLCGLYGMDVPANCVPLESGGSMFPDHWQQDERL